MSITYLNNLHRSPPLEDQALELAEKWAEELDAEDCIENPIGPGVLYTRKQVEDRVEGHLFDTIYELAHLWIMQQRERTEWD